MTVGETPATAVPAIANNKPIATDAAKPTPPKALNIFIVIASVRECADAADRAREIDRLPPFELQTSNDRAW